MNLHELVRARISIVNPFESVVILVSTGFTITAQYEQVPAWAPAVEVMAQPQPVADKTLQFLVQQRQNTIWHDFYLSGDWSALDRPAEQGGDLLYWDGAEWQVDQVLERWNPTAGWTKIRCVKLRETAPPEVGATEPPKGGDDE